MAAGEAFRQKLIRKGDPYIINEDLNHFFDFHDVSEIVRMWNGGEQLEHLAKQFNRDPDEIFLLLFDQARKGKIKRYFAKRL